MLSLYNIDRDTRREGPSRTAMPSGKTRGTSDKKSQSLESYVDKQRGGRGGTGFGFGFEWGRVGQDRTGQGRTGQDRAGQKRAFQGGAE